jgi:hypothetical protein
MRFPRLIQPKSVKQIRAEQKDPATRTMSRIERYEMRVAAGDIPKGYDRLSGKQKRIAKMIARGISHHDACKIVGVARDTFYRWRRSHLPFRKFLAKACLRYASHVDESLESKLPRAVQVVEDALNSGDQYFEYDAARDLLKGRSKYKTSVMSKQEITGGLAISGKHEIHTHGMDKDMVMMFVNALVGKAQETKALPPPIDIKALPEYNDDTEVQDKEERETA